MKSAGPSAPVTVRAASANRSSQVGSRPLPSARWAVKRRAVVEGGQVVGADHQQDVGGVAGDEVHEPAHVRPAVHRVDVVDHVEIAGGVADGGQQDRRLGSVLGAVVDDVGERLPQADALLGLVEPGGSIRSNQAS